MRRYIVFILLFFVKKNQKVIFQRDCEQKPLTLQQQFLTNVTFFMRGTSSLFYCFLSKKRTKVEIFERIEQKPNMIQRQFP